MPLFHVATPSGLSGLIFTVGISQRIKFSATARHGPICPSSLAETSETAQSKPLPRRAFSSYDLRALELALAGTAGLIALDQQDEPYFRRTSTFDGFNRTMSFNGTIAAIAAAPATTYLVGLVSQKSYAKQTAELTVETLIAAGIPALVTRDIARRVPPSDIPSHGDFSDSWFRSHRGPFYLGAGGFPSGHTLAAFSVATIFAERYRNHQWVRWVAYTGAGAIAFSRITKQAHFPSDVFAGAVLGYTTAHLVISGRN